MLKKLKNDILDLIFPPRCLNCDKLGNFLCQGCHSKIIKIGEQHCPFCHGQSKNGRTCVRCRRRHKLGGAVALGYFHDPVLKKVIHEYKYQGISAASSELAQLLVGLVGELEVIAFVPASKARYRERGYNQAELLANELGDLTGRPVYRGLLKSRHTKRQVGLKRRERISNLEDVFNVEGVAAIRGRRVLIIDDVLTTGATLDACARVLREHGAKEVRGLVLARE